MVVLGSTGSIGKQALDVIAHDPDSFELLGMSCGSNCTAFSEQIEQYAPKLVAGMKLPDPVSNGTERMIEGIDGILSLAAHPDADVIVNGISGFAALSPLLASLKAGKTVALANKESIVCGRNVVNRYLKTYGGRILPVDSEQSAIFQCMQAGRHSEIKTLWLTCSGGRFWQRPFEELAEITPEEALDHPTWSMGAKITIDSATLFNKGLEVMEASYLFDIPGEKIRVLIHPQSVVHSMVEYVDGTVMADMSCPDMRLPIQYALSYPERIPSPCKPLSLAEYGTLSFFDASPEKYPALRMAYDALAAGGSAPVAYNAANEAAVALFFERKIGFTDIYDAAAYVLEHMHPNGADSVEEINEADAEARELVKEWFSAMKQ